MRRLLVLIRGEIFGLASVASVGMSFGCGLPPLYERSVRLPETILGFSKV